MAQLGRIDYTFLTAAGLPVVGATVEVRKPGAQIKTGGPNVFTVDDPGALAVNDNCVLNSSSSPVRAVTAVGATIVTVGAGGFTPTVDDDRISVASPLVTIYSDAVGTDTIANPLTTDNNGRVVCYVVGGKYDLLATAPLSYNLQPQLVQDIVAEGAENNRSNVFPTGSAVAWVLDTYRTLGAGDKALSVRNNGSEEFSIGPSGVTAAIALVAQSTLAVTGASTLTGAVTAQSTLGATGLITGAVGVTATTGNIQATAGDFDGRRLNMDNGTDLVNGDFALSAGWGDTATVSVTAGSKDTRGRFAVTSNGTGQASGGSVVLTFKDGTFGHTVRACATRRDGTAPTTGFWTVSEGATGCTFTFIGVPVAGNVYECSYIIVG